MSECQYMEEQQLKKRDCTPRNCKANRILEAAKSCFLNYGFKRTSMADIAEKVGISRPALYLHFENKEAIFRALSAQLHEATLEQAAKALRQKGTIGDRLLQAFESKYLKMFKLVCDSSHGEELVDIYGQVAADIYRLTEEKFAEMLTEVLCEAEATEEIQLENLDIDARQTAELLINSARGLKQGAGTTEDYCLSLQRLIKMFEKAVVAK